MRENYNYSNSEISKELHWFMETLKKEFEVKVAVEDIGLEATELGTEEVADFYVPSELFTEVPDKFLYEVMVVDDDYYNEWIGAVVFYPNTSNWCLQIVIKNGDLIKRTLISNTV